MVKVGSEVHGKNGRIISSRWIRFEGMDSDKLGRCQFQISKLMHDVHSG